MSQQSGHRRNAIAPGVILTWLLFATASSAAALEPSLQISQYAHTSWKSKDGYSLGAVFSIAQTPDGYLWLASEYGLARFDGLHFTSWRPPAGQELPNKPYSLLVSRDGTLWIGTFAGLASWNGIELTRYPETDTVFLTSLLEDRDGTIWAGFLANEGGLCEIRGGRAQCEALDGGFGRFVWSLAEDSAGALWASAQSGLWRWKPGPPKRYAASGIRLGDLITTDEGKLLIGVRSAGLRQLAGEELAIYPIRSVVEPTRQIPDPAVKSNKLLRDREGGIWIGTEERGLIHVKDGMADTFTKADGLSGNIACSLFEDREGSIWFTSERGLDRFRKLPVTTISMQQGLSSDATKSVLASADGSVWIATIDGMTRWKDGRLSVFRKESGLPGVEAQSLTQDAHGRVWVSTNQGLAYFEADKFVPVSGQPNYDISSMVADEADNLWLSGDKGLTRFHNGRFVETFPWSGFGRLQRAGVLAPDRGGLWMSFWRDGGVLYLKDGKVRATYTSAEGLGAGHVPGLRVDRDGAVWAATEDGGLSRIEDGRVDTLTTGNGLPCNTVHWSIEDDARSLWLYTACGLLRITREEVEAWLADPTHRVAMKRWSAADGVRTSSVSAAYFNPPATKAADGKIWFLTGDAVQVIDPNHLPFNSIPPPVYVERIVADRIPYAVAEGLRLPPLVRDLTIEFTALSLVDPQNAAFRYQLEGHDEEWQEVVNLRQATYTNLSPGSYRFRVKAANNSGVWNETGAQLAFTIAPAFYQTNWFRAACGVLLVGLIWGGFKLRVRRLKREEKRLRDVIAGIPAMAFSVNPDGSPDLANQRWLDYAGLSKKAQASSRDWESTIHPDDVETHLNKWKTALATGEPFENEARHRSATGEYRWFLVRAVPLRDKQGKILKWYGTLTDIEERKRAEEERERLQRLEAHLAHTNRLSMLGELTASLAHEINQPIAAAITSAGACLRWLDREQPELQRAREAIIRIKDDGKRAADIITGLKAFYRKEAAPRRGLLDVNEVVREMLVLLHREAERHSITMRTELAQDLPKVRADRVQLQQVLMNLMVNAIEAMGGRGGELTIRTMAAESGMEVSVSDTGVGIPDDKLEHIFSAFVTTKPEGTGMGLAISRTIVESHGGKLWAEANPGPGATFHFTLPSASEVAMAHGDEHANA